jgi:HK97 family phage portal protein
MSLRTWFGRRFGLTDTAAWSYISGGSSAAGKAVTDRSMIGLATAWACVRVNSETVGATPFHLHDYDTKNRVDHPLADIISRSPDGERTAGEFWGAMAAWLLVRGNAYAEIVREGERVVALNLIPADQVNVTRDLNGDLHYRFTDRGQPVDLTPDRMLHIRGFGFGGDCGLSPVTFGVQTFGSAIAADEMAAKMMASGLMASGLLIPEKDMEITKEHREQLRGILKEFQGSDNAGKTLLVPPGLNYERLSFDPETTQMLATRQFNVEEICRWFGTPPVVVGHAANGVTAWGTGIESLFLQWLATGLDPLFSRIEKRVTFQLLGAADRRRIYVEFNREALLRTDSAAKIAFLSSAVQNGLMTRNEGRAKLNLPSVDGGDQLTAQTNLAPLDQLGASDPRAAMRNALGIQEPA